MKRIFFKLKVLFVILFVISSLSVYSSIIKSDKTEKISEYKSIYQPYNFDDFKKKSYYSKIFNSKDRTKLDKLDKIYKKGNDYIKDYESQIKEYNQSMKLLSSAKNANSKNDIMKKASKTESKALKNGFKAMKYRSECNTGKYEIYNRNIPTVKKSGNPKYAYAEKLEKEAVDDYRISLNYMTQSEMADGKEKFTAVKNADDKQTAALDKFEKAFGLYMDDPEIKIPDTTVVINISNQIDTTKKKVAIIIKGGNKKDTTVYISEKDINLYHSQETVILPKLKRSAKEIKLWEDANDKKAYAVSRINEVNALYCKSDSIDELISNEKDLGRKEQLNVRKDEYERISLEKLVNAINLLFEINETKYNIYKAHYADLKPKKLSEDLTKGIKYEKEADISFAEAKRQFDVATKLSDQSDKYINLMEANNKALLALQFQEDAYMIYLKQQPWKKIPDPVKPVVIADTRKGQKNTNQNINTQSIVFKIQVGLFRKALAPEKLDQLKPIVTEKVENSPYSRVLVGEYQSSEAADLALTKVKVLGYKDAFIAAYINKVRSNYSTANGKLLKDSRYKQIMQKELDLLNGIVVVPVEEPNNTDFVKGPDVKSLKGTNFLVQIGLFTIPKTKNDLASLAPVFVDRTLEGKYKYFSGAFSTMEEANQHLQNVVNENYKDAFIAAYKDGVLLNIKNLNSEVNENKSVNKSKTNNITFKVQIGAFADNIPANLVKKINDLSKLHTIEKKPDGKGSTIYSVGKFNNYQEALNLKKSLAKEGFAGCFVTSYQGDKKIKIEEAVKLSKQ